MQATLKLWHLPERPAHTAFAPDQIVHIDMLNECLHQNLLADKVRSQSRFNCGATFQIELGAANRSFALFRLPTPSLPLVPARRHAVPVPCRYDNFLSVRDGRAETARRRAACIFDSMPGWILHIPPN